MKEEDVFPEVAAATRAGDAAAVRDLLMRWPDLLKGKANRLLRTAASKDRVEIMALLVEFGADINAPQSERDPEGALVYAAGEGALNAVRWLLNHGAKVNHEVKGVTRCFALTRAVHQGHLELVKLLVERGADINAPWGDVTPLAYAVMYDKKEVEAYLRSKGALEPHELAARKPPQPEAPRKPAKKRRAKAKGPVTEQEMLDWFESAWHPVYQQGEEDGLESLDQKDRVLYLVGYLIDQLVCGGAEMVYFNPSGAYAVQIVEALEKIGAAKAAGVMREINAMFPGGRPATDDNTRQQQLDKLPSEVVRKGKELDEIFDEWLPDNGGRVMLRQLFDYYHSPAGGRNRRAKK